ncbi:Bacterial Ig-like domain (group 2) [Candidatus Methanoperedenaceae archaeon GB50]|nr:Bacterial Ig-like domain (group 2) [Candidatus Methanoperedenaceae archaeon GB50]
MNGMMKGRMAILAIAIVVASMFIPAVAADGPPPQPVKIQGDVVYENGTRVPDGWLVVVTDVTAGIELGNDTTRDVIPAIPQYTVKVDPSLIVEGNEIKASVSNGSWSGEVTYTIQSGDNAEGNTITMDNIVVTMAEIDTTPPETTCSVTPMPNDKGWNEETPVTVTFFRSDDDSGVAYTNWSNVSETGPWTQVGGNESFSVTITTMGEHTIWFYSVDNAGNEEDVKNVTVKIAAPPTITSYEISKIEIRPPEETEIDVAFSEHVSYVIAIEKDGAVVYDWTGSATNPDPKIWDGTNESTGSAVPAGDYTVNVTGTNTTTGFSVVNNTETIRVREPKSSELTTIEVTPKTASLTVGETQQFTATAYDQYGDEMTGIIFTWTSSNTTVGAVDEAGLFTSLVPGTTTVTAANGSVNGTAEVTVSPEPPVLTTIEVTPKTASLTVGETQQFTATAYDQYGDEMTGIIFTWTSSNTTVGAVDEAGLFTSLVPGTTTVTAANGSVNGTAEVTVSPEPPVLTTIEVTPKTASLTVGETQQFTATAYDQYGDEMTGIIFTWTSSNTTVGAVDEAGLFTSLVPGTTTVTAANGSVNGTAEVTVSPEPPVLTTIEVTPKTASLTVGETQQFTATAYDQYGDEMTGIIFTWTSSNTTVGAVDEAGLFTSLVPGTTTVTAANGSVNGTAEVTVNPVLGAVVRIDDGITSHGGKTTVELWALNVTDLATFDITISYNASVVNVTGAENNPELGDSLNNLENARNGSVRLGNLWYTHEGLDGDVLLSTLTLQAVGEADDVTDLVVTINTLSDSSENPIIPVAGVNGSFTVWITGDISGDRKVDLNDAVYLGKYVLDWSGYEEIYANGDINCDGVVDLKDAVYLGKHVLGWSGYEEIC